MPSCHIHTYTKIEANRALVLRNPMAERAKGRPSDALSVMVIDEDEFHANSAKSMLSELNYYVAVYTSPIEALGILEKKAHDVDFIMAAVDMEELNGFQFLEAAKDMHRNLQVISVGDKAQHGKEVGESVAQQKDGTKTTTQLKWIPFLESKFLYALQILGANASPSKIKIIMNMDTVTTKQISAHLQCQTCEGCDAQPGGTNYPVALQSLSGATNLKLKIYDPTRLSIFRMDLKWRPVFRKLKTLLLNEWCVGDDFTGLIYFLQHSPILETLKLQLDLESSEDYHLSKTDESCNLKEQSLLSPHLKVVKIICCTPEDVIVRRILKILCAHGVPYEKIEVEVRMVQFRSIYDQIIPVIQT
ncbi:uncharacterized protein [Aegilops tauschii subsp. strangulata]